MPVCVPIKDLKNTAAFAKKVQESPTPVTITKNGYDEFVVMRSADYEAMQEELAKNRLYARIIQAERELTEGKRLDGPAVIEEMKERYGL